MISNVTYNDTLLAIIVRNTFKQDGITFFTEPHLSQQLGYMNRPLGHVIPPHKHHVVEFDAVQTQEVLVIKSGKLRVDFYDDSQQYIESYVLNTGDIILLLTGGHGFEMLEQTEIIEIKQGPYIGEKEKIRFHSVDKSNLIIK